MNLKNLIIPLAVLVLLVLLFVFVLPYNQPVQQHNQSSSQLSNQSINYSSNHSSNQSLSLNDTKPTKIQWVCGSTHNHILISEFENGSEQRVKSLHEAIAASKEAGMSFIVLSEKGAIYDDGTNGKGWQDMLRECNNVTSADFVCLYGQEICTHGEAKEPIGHFVTVDNNEYITGPSLAMAENKTTKEIISGIVDNAHKQNAVAILAHPFYKKSISIGYNYNRWDLLDWDALEIINGVIDDAANQEAKDKLYDLWNQGIRKSAVGGADLKTIVYAGNSTGIVDREVMKNKLMGGFTCLYLGELDRKNIKGAIKNGNGYVSSGPRIKNFAINGAMMGQNLSIKTGYSLSVTIGAKDSSKIKQVILIENDQALKTFYPMSEDFSTTFSLYNLTPGSNWYSLEVYSQNGMAVANAIWVNNK